MNTPNSSSPSPPDSTTASEVLKKYTMLDQLIMLADKARATQGLLTPTETLELVDLAEHWYWKYIDRCIELDQALWDLEHPKHKDL